MTTLTALPRPVSAAGPDASAAGKSKTRALLGATPFILVHVFAFGAIWTGVNTIDWVVGVSLYWIRMFGVTGAYHRYFSHRTYKTSRWFQFCLALLAQSSSQKGVLWWGAHHRHHHKYSDQPEDIHSPKRKGLFYAHVGWMFDGKNDDTDYEKIKDFAKYPELVFLNRHWWLPPAALGFGIWLWLGWSGLFIGFLASTAVLWHGTFTINSLTHVWGKQVYETGEDSKNSFILAIITMGEGWHNNHHYYQASTPQGFHWWQIDMTYYILRALSWVGLIWDLRMPPKNVIDGTWRPNKSGRSDASSRAA